MGNLISVAIRSEQDSSRTIPPSLLLCIPFSWMMTSKMKERDGCATLNDPIFSLFVSKQVKAVKKPSIFYQKR